MRLLVLFIYLFENVQCIKYQRVQFLAKMGQFAKFAKLSPTNNSVLTVYCELSELSNPGSIPMMYVRTAYVCMYVSVTLRNVVVMSCRNVRSMMRIRTPSIWWTTGCDCVVLTIVVILFPNYCGYIP